jgi:hypothetical protein
MAEFSELIASLRSGAADRLGTKMIRLLVEAVRATEKGGKITLEIGIAPLKDGDGELEVKAKLKLTLPAEEIKSAIYYADDANHLIRTDPRQMSMLPDRTETERNERQREQNLAQVGRGDGKVLDLQANR